MSRTSMLRVVAIAGFLASSTASVAMAEPVPTRATGGTTLSRANADVLNKLRPSGLREHGANIARIAGRGYHDFLVTIHAPSARPHR